MYSRRQQPFFCLTHYSATKRTTENTPPIRRFPQSPFHPLAVSPPFARPLLRVRVVKLMNEEPRVIRLHAADDVVIAINPIESGTWLEGVGIRAANTIPAGHKMATRAIEQGEPVKRYNQIIGFAAKQIGLGQHTHVHNLTLHDLARDYAFCADRKPPVPVEKEAFFKGIGRSPGRVATRNYVGIVSTVNCSATVSKKIAALLNREVLPPNPNVHHADALRLTTRSGTP